MAVLAPCRAALQGAFPLSGTYFQTNEAFLLHAGGRLAVLQVRAWPSYTSSRRSA